MFDWDAQNIAHIARHGVTPDEAEQALDIAPIEIMEQVIDGEVRRMEIGHTQAMRILVVITTPRGELLRVATAYPAPPAMRERYLRLRRNEYGY